jgi:hypothetical protein
MSNRTEIYLEQVTAGLKDDAELRLDVRAELASHLEDKAAELQGQGTPEEEAREQAMAALGEPAEVATGLAQGNCRRLRRRAWLRRGLRFALVPTAVVVAILCSDLQWAAAIGMVRQLDGGGVAPLRRLGWLGRKLMGVEDVPPLLKVAPRQRWESDPSNRIFYADFISHDVAQAQASTEAERQPLLALLETARTLDPDNARYDYLRAAVLLRGACAVQAQSGPKGADGKAGPPALTWEVKDRALLDQAMAHLLSGLRKPEFRRYGREMLALQLEAMGYGDRLLQRIERISMCAGALLPDLQKLRELARVAYLYGDTLAKEGRSLEARPYLDAWKTLTVQLNADSWTLIDCLVVMAIANGIPEHAARTYEGLGLADEAARTRRQGELLGRPGKEWRERRDDPAVKAADRESEKEMKLYAGVLTGMLLPALHEWPTREEYDAGRRLEYAVAMQAGVTVLSAALLLAMVVCLLISLRWRFMSGGAAIPILLLPDGRAALRILALGVLLPLVAYAGVVLFVPGSGQCYSVQSGLHKVLGEFVLLAIAILVAPAWLAVQEARRRCRELGLASGNRARLWEFLPLGLCALAVAVVWCVPPKPGKPFEPALFILIITLLVLFITASVAALFLLLARAEHGLYSGTVARSLIPLFAAAVMVLSITTRPLLLRAEQRCLAADTILLPGPHEIGFSRIENRVTERLQKAVAAAAAGLERR